MEENVNQEKATWLEPIAQLLEKGELKRQLIVMLNDSANCIMERASGMMPPQQGKDPAASAKFQVVTSKGTAACYVISRQVITTFPDRVSAVANEKGNLVCFI